MCFSLQVAIHFIFEMVYSKINKVKVFLHESDYPFNYKHGCVSSVQVV